MPTTMELNGRIFSTAEVAKGLPPHDLVLLLQSGKVSKAQAYHMLEVLAAEQRRPSESQSQAFSRYVLGDEVGKGLYRIQAAMSGSDIERPSYTGSVKEVDLGDPELSWNCLVAGIARFSNISISKAGDAARATPEGMALWRKFHKPPVVDAPSQSRGYGDTGISLPQRSMNSGQAGSENPEAEVMSEDYADPKAALARFMRIVEDLEVKYQLSQAEAMDKARIKYPEL